MKAIESTSPLTPTSILDSVYGAVALKLNMPFLVWVWPAWVMVLKSPTAYIRLPHLTSCLTFWVPFPLAGVSWGVPFAGVVDTPPVAVAAPAVAAPAGVAAAYQADPAASATAITPARPGSRRTLRKRIISSCREPAKRTPGSSYVPAASAAAASPRVLRPRPASCSCLR